jgi:hypothetical protein
MEALEKDIKAKCGGDLEANIHKPIKPRLVMYNIPEDITKTLEDMLMAQKHDINFKEITLMLNSATKQRKSFGTW